MSDSVTVHFGPNVSDDAVLLLAAAEELGLGAGAVKTIEGAFVVSQEVYDTAFGVRKDEAPAKKTTAKKAAAKKSTAKKAGD